MTTLKDVQSGYGLATTINENNATIEAALDAKVSRKEGEPSQLETYLDANGSRIVNLPDAVANGEPITLGQGLAGIGVTDTAITQENLGKVLYPLTQAETNAGILAYNGARTIGDIVVTNYPAGDIRRYGATTALANNTLAIQAAINQCSHGGAKVYVPKGRWTHTGTIYYYYDASNNPEFQTDQVPEGDLLIEGDGPTDYGFEFNASPDTKASRGSVLYYEGSGNAHSLDGSEIIHCVKHRDLSLVGDTTGVIYRADNVARNLGLENVFVGNHNNGAGQCIHCTDSYYVKISDCYVATKGNTTSETAVFENPTDGGGVFIIHGTTFRGGATACRLGVQGTGSAQAMQNPNVYACQFKTAANGLIIGAGCKAGVISGNYFEYNTVRSLWIYNGAKSLDIVGNWFGNKDGDRVMTAHIELGLRGSTASQTENSFGGVAIRNNLGDADTHPFLMRTIHPGGTGGRNQTTIDGNNFGGDHSVSVDNDGGEGLIFTNNRLGGRDDSSLTGVIEAASLFISGGDNSATRGDVAIDGVWQYGDGVRKLYTYADNGGNLDVSRSLHKIDASGGATALTLPDGIAKGQRSTIILTSSTNALTLTTTNRKSPLETTTVFSYANNMIDVIWDGNNWRQTYTSIPTTDPLGVEKVTLDGEEWNYTIEPTKQTTIVHATSADTGNILTLSNAAAHKGQIVKILYVGEAAGGDTIVVTPTNLHGYTTVTLNAVWDSVELIWTGSNWQVSSVIGTPA